MKHRKLKNDEILANITINFDQFPELKYIQLGNEVKQKPDIQIWVYITKEDEIVTIWKFYIVEIAIPFGKEDKEGEHSKALKAALGFKTIKYRSLVRTLRSN
jgi:hypothetical protein